MWKAKMATAMASARGDAAGDVALEAEYRQGEEEEHDRDDGRGGRQAELLGV